MKPYYIYTQRICAELMLKGHKLIGLEPSEKRSGMNVFVFIESKKLKEDIDKIKSIR